jgi:hydroxymethylpyrimidine pyrophosphatase-like HAD family hydrolase
VRPSAFFPRRLSKRAQSELLRGVIARSHFKHGEHAPVIVFDLDGTLLDNRPRVAKIFQELAEHWAAEHPEDSAKLARVTARDIVYGVEENLARFGVTDPARVAFGRDFWKDRFFVDDYIRYDVPTKGAVEFVRACYDAGATLVYLTGRDLPNMAVGTFASLRDQGFPIGVVGTSLVTKPAFDIPDAEFKNDVAPALVRHGRIVAAFDNEPANNNLFVEHHVEAMSVFLDTQHAPDPPSLHDKVLVLEDFEIEG